MSFIRHLRFSAVIVPVIALCLGLLPACSRGGAGGTHLIIPEGCAVTAAELQGTWVISHVASTLTCPVGSTIHTTATPNNFSPVTVVRDESLPGFKITAAGLTATVADVTCHIVWTYRDQATNAMYECFTTFHPDTRTAGGTTEAGHSDQVTLINKDGSLGASCSIPLPYLDSYVVVQGS
jgi:hypothetical protein